MTENFEKRGYINVDHEIENADIYIVNTCTVTNLSDRKSRQFIRRAKRDNPNAVVAVVGCYSQVSPKEVSEIKGVDIILGTTERHKIVDLYEEYLKDKKQINMVRPLKGDREFQRINIENTADMTRAYMKVQDGCNRFCSYCIIPYARGNIRSRSIEDSVNEAEILSRAGFKEIVLTGIHIGSYGYDLGNERLIDLIESIAKVDGIERIRLSSIEPGTITEDFIKRGIATGKLCDHFHLSLQSGSDEILKSMNRKYSSKDYFEKIELIRKFMPNAGLTTDVIVGFPGESDEDFEDSYDFIKKVDFSRIHIFKYSKRSGTKAAEMKNQVNGNVKIKRANILSDLNKDLMKNFAKKNLNKVNTVLFEKNLDISSNKFVGYTTNYIRCYTETNLNLKNQIKDVKIIDIDGEFVKTELI